MTCHHVFQEQSQVWALSKGGTTTAVVHTTLTVQRGCKSLLFTEETTTMQWFRPSLAGWSEIQCRYVWKLSLKSWASQEPS